MRLAEFALLSLVVELTPGPNMAYLAALTLQAGWRSGLFALAGIALGLAVYGGLASAGLSVLIAGSPLAYQALRYAGIAYLLYLAYDTWRGDGEEGALNGKRHTNIDYFYRGLLTNLLNPKAMLFYAAVLPQFLPEQAPGTAALLSESLLLVAIYVGVATGVHLAIVLGATRVLALFKHGTPKQLNPVFALLLVAIALWLWWSTRPHVGAP